MWCLCCTCLRKEKLNDGTKGNDSTPSPKNTPVTPAPDPQDDGLHGQTPADLDAVNVELRDKEIMNRSTLHHSVFEQSDFNPMAVDTPSLSASQKAALKKSWAAINEMPNPFKTIVNAFVRMFVLAPESRRSFHAMLGDVGSKEEEMLQNSVMKKHLGLVWAFFNNVLDSLDSLESSMFKTERMDLGARHVPRANPYFLRILCWGLMFAIEKTLWPEVDIEILEAWEALLIIIAQDWTTGFNKQQQQAEQPVKEVPHSDSTLL